MAVPAERAFWKSLQSKAFSPVYYLCGDDEYLKDQALRALIASAVDPATRDFNLDVRAGADVDAETVGSLLATPPMMAERRVVVFRDVAAMKKDARAALDRALERLRAAPPAVRARLGNPLSPGMTGPLLALVARTDPVTLWHAVAAVQPKDWLRAAVAGPGAVNHSRKTTAVTV